MLSGFVQRGGCWVLLQGLLMLAVFGLAAFFPGTWSWPPSRILGTALLALSGLIALAAVIALGRIPTPFPKPIPQGRLVQRGIYALMRHPLYTSVMLGAFGLGLLRQSWPAILAAGLLALFFKAKARREEAWLLAQFPEYHAYCQRVRRFIPRL